MELDEALMGRRSIRRYTDKPVSDNLVHQILEAGIWAPSAHNGQQWRFTVLTDDAKKKLITLSRSELEKLSARIGLKRMGSSFESCTAMEKAPVLIIVWNANNNRMLAESSLQSVAAAIQNMLLKAYSLGLGSLWICDICDATKAITKHFNKTWKLVAAMSLGWPAEAPKPRPRKPVEEVSEFLK
jgi:nitroreductase